MSTRPADPATTTDPRQVRSRALILAAALDHFGRHGYIGGNVDEIAAEAGVAKKTVYNLFHTKDELFHAVVLHATETAEAFISATLESEVGQEPVADEITRLAVAHARAVISPRVVATRRLLIGEASRFPALAADYYARVPDRVMDALARRLRRYGDAGLLTVADARESAEHFSFLVLGPGLDRALFHPDALDDADVERRARSGAQVFLRAALPR